LRTFVIQRWFLILLATVLAAGIAQWGELMPLAEAAWLRNGVVATVLFLMALPLPAETTWRALRRPVAPLLGVAVNFGLLPLAAWGISFALRADTAAGLLVAAATPCTLASAAVWTRRAGGNDAAALLVTVLTNAFCFVITPLWLTLTLGTRVQGISIDAGKMVNDLALLVVLPMAAGQLVRLYRPLGSWATRRGRLLSVAAQCGILTMVLIGAIKTGQMLHEQPAETAFAWWDWGEMIAATLGLHLGMLTAGVWLAAACRLPRGDRIAVGISGSQKTLMVGLQVALAAHIIILPMVVYHVGQLIVDTIIADRWRRAGEETRVDKNAKS
jgi:solute carrier family 10 (sodium/bile acid cotransporter), member 7